MSDAWGESLPILYGRSVAIHGSFTWTMFRIRKHMSAYDPIRDVTSLSSLGGNGKKKIHYFAHIDGVCAWLFEYLLTELALEAICERGRPGFRSCPMRGARSTSLGEDCEGCSIASKLCGENRCERQKSQHRGRLAAQLAAKSG